MSRRIGRTKASCSRSLSPRRQYMRSTATSNAQNLLGRGAREPAISTKISTNGSAFLSRQEARDFSIALHQDDHETRRVCTEKNERQARRKNEAPGTQVPQFAIEGRPPIGARAVARPDSDATAAEKQCWSWWDKTVKGHRGRAKE